MTQVQSTFKIRRFWFNYNTPEPVLAGLNWRMGTHFGVNSVAGRAPYVDVHYWGDGDRNITIMELKYSDYIFAREELTYILEGDDGLGDPDADTN